MLKNFDETVRLQSEIRREWIREIIGQRLQGIAEGASSAPRLASSSAASFPGRNECPGTHCSLIKQEERRQFLPDLSESFVASANCVASFTNRTFHLSRPPGFRMAFDTAERNGRFGRIQCQRGKESSCRGKRKRQVFLFRRTVGVKVKGKVIPASFLKIEGRRTLVGARDRRERDR